MKQTLALSTMTLAAIVLTLSGCGKVSENKLLGKTYEVQDIAIYEGTNLATWRNTHADEDFGEGDLAWNITDSDGHFTFGDDGEVDFYAEVATQTVDSLQQVHINQGGTLVMDGRQDWFDVDGGTHGYTQYFIEEKNGRELVIAWEQLFGQYGYVFLFKVKR